VVPVLRSRTFENYSADSETILLVGAGFYVAPVYVDGHEKYRVGYGFHNAYLFALEQSGIIGFVLFLIFLFSMGTYLVRARRRNFGYEGDFGNATLAIFLAMLVIGWIGLGFWLGFTGFLPVYLILIYILGGYRNPRFLSWFKRRSNKREVPWRRLLEVVVPKVRRERTGTLSHLR